MGFLDRFKSGASGPDALTTEVAARLRALPTVEQVEAVDADSVAVEWAGHPGRRTVDLGDLRPRWKQASGFDRIQLMDDFIDGLSPETGAPVDAAGAGPGQQGPRDEPSGDRPPPGRSAPEPPPREVDAPDAGSWDRLRARVLPVLVAGGTGPTCVRWPVGGGVDATVVADGTPVAPDDCERWGVGELDVRTAATANLRGIEPAPEAIGPGARAWVPTAPAGHQSCWLTAPGPLLAAIGLDEGVAFAPLVGELVVVDPADEDLLRTILTSTEQIVADQPEPLSPLPFRLTPAGAEPWIPDTDHPLSAHVTALRDRYA